MVNHDPNDWDAHFVLTADVDLSGYSEEEFNLIGVWFGGTLGRPFTGVFDGNNHTISKITQFEQGVNQFLVISLMKTY